jgi:hypothetical protein
MLYYVVPDGKTASLLNQECLRITFPEPFDQGVRSKKVFGYFPHLLDESSYGWCIYFPESAHRSVCWVTKLIFKAKGALYNLDSDDRNLVKSQFSSKNLQNYQRWDGTYPYKNSYDLLKAIVGYWQRFTEIIPDPADREKASSLILSSRKVPLRQLMSLLAPEISYEEFWNRKYSVATLNLVDSAQLSYDRFPNVDSTLAARIIEEREKGDYESLDDLSQRCDLPEEVKKMFEQQLQEGSFRINV